MRPLLRMSTVCLLLGASAPAHSSDLNHVPGPSTVQCGSFAVGPSSCTGATGVKAAAVLSEGAPSIAARTPASPTPDLSPARDKLDQEVDAFVANHGKPSREAARALLDPTDDNIAAMLRRLQRDQAIAAYVGQRMTEMQQADPTLAAPSNAVPMDLPAFSGIRLLLITQPQCERCDRAAQALQRLVAMYPTLDARIGVAGLRDARALIQEMARTGVTLPTSAAEETLLQRVRLVPPFLIVADVRRQREGYVVDVEDTERLRLAVLEFQRGATAVKAKTTETIKE